jgi:hypothetical protein
MTQTTSAAHVGASAAVTATSAARNWQGETYAEIRERLNREAAIRAAEAKEDEALSHAEKELAAHIRFYGSNHGHVCSSQVRIGSVHNTESGYKMFLHSYDGRTLTRRISATEARVYFQLPDARKLGYLCTVWNDYEDTASGLRTLCLSCPQVWRAVQHIAEAPQRQLTPAEERFHWLEAQRQINPLPGLEEEEYQRLKEELY